MNKLKELVREIDQFGVIFQPQLVHASKEYKTILGGVMSIVLYGLSLSYFIYYIVQWRTDKLLPKITTTSEAISYQEFNITQEDFISFSIRNLDNQTLDPFNSEAVIIQPLLYIFTDGRAPNKAYTLNYSSQKEGMTHISMKGVHLTGKGHKNKEQSEISVMIAFGECLEGMLLPGQKCANQTLVNQYFGQRLNAMVVEFKQQQFNAKSKQIEDIIQKSSIPFTNTSTYYSSNTLKITTVAMDDSFLFENEQEFQFISQIENVGQTAELNYFKQVFNYRLQVLYELKLGSINSFQSIQYPKANEILADAGSIVSLLLVLQFIVLLANQRFLQDEAIDSVIQMYFPRWKDFEIKRSIFGEISEVRHKKFGVHLEKFRRFYEKARLVAERKLCISNQIYELSRIQFALQQLQPREVLQSMHRVGIALPNFCNQKKGEDANKSSISNMKDASNKIVIEKLESNAPEEMAIMDQIHSPEGEPDGTVLSEQDFGLLVQEIDPGEDAVCRGGTEEQQPHRRRHQPREQGDQGRLQEVKTSEQVGGEARHQVTLQEHQRGPIENGKPGYDVNTIT